MGISMMLTVMAEGKSLDIMIKPEQRIGDVYQSLVKAGYLLSAGNKEKILVYSMRQKAYKSPESTFEQEKIYNGDILRIE